MANWTEEEARAFGLVKDERTGNWSRGKKKTVDSKSRDTSQVPKSEQNIRREPSRQDEIKEGIEGSYDISIISYSQRHRDPDNICPKAFIDYLVEEKDYLIDDSSKYVSSVTKRVVKVKTKEEEKTVIEIWKNI